jgi:Zn-dependent protease with chaperone function
MIGALAAFGLAPNGDVLVGSTEPAAVRLQPWNIVALSGAGLLTAHLLINLGAAFVLSERDRRRHSHLVMLLSAPVDAATRIIDSPTPVAYCLPGPFRSVTIYSRGLVELLSHDELRAVIEHEKAHVVQRHDIVLIAFKAWRASLPWFPIAYRAQLEVGLLIEMLADDRARHFVTDAVLARAIELVSDEALTVKSARIRIARLVGTSAAPPAARNGRRVD